MIFDKNKVYTMLNADEVKAGSKGYFAEKLKDLRAIVSEEGDLRALVDVLGEEYERRFDEGGNIWNLFYLVEEPEIDKYRPYKDTDEMIEDFRERAKAYEVNLSKCPMFYPSIWLKSKENGDKPLCTYFGVSNVLVGMKYFSLETLFKKYTYLDGSPCGKKKV